MARAVSPESGDERVVDPRIPSRECSGQESGMSGQDDEDGGAEGPHAQDRSFADDQVGEALEDEEEDLFQFFFGSFDWRRI